MLKFDVSAQVNRKWLYKVTKDLVTGYNKEFLLATLSVTQLVNSSKVNCLSEVIRHSFINFMDIVNSSEVNCLSKVI